MGCWGGAHRAREPRAEGGDGASAISPPSSLHLSAACAVLVGLYEEPEKPSQAIEFIKMQLGAPGGADVEALKSENENLKDKVEELTKELEEAKAKLAELAPPE